MTFAKCLNRFVKIFNPLFTYLLLWCRKPSNRQLRSNLLDSESRKSNLVLKEEMKINHIFYVVFSAPFRFFFGTQIRVRVLKNTHKIFRHKNHVKGKTGYQTNANTKACLLLRKKKHKKIPTVPTNFCSLFSKTFRTIIMLKIRRRPARPRIRSIWFVKVLRSLEELVKFVRIIQQLPNIIIEMNTDILALLERIYKELCKKYVNYLKNVLVPRTRYSPKGDNYFQTSCTICLNDFQANDFTRTLKCNHKFHVICIDKWLKNNDTCPICRQRVLNVN
uniref:RING-type domain-containing protein n=1 Tax=Glossina brevipalpis TaxID=37001 RepID=A0A1A9VZV0_9MUSC